MTDDAAIRAVRRAVFSEVSDLILKGGGISAIAGILAASAMKIDMIIFQIPMVIAGLVLSIFAAFVFLVAAIKLDEAFIKSKKIPVIDEPVVAFTLAALIVFSMMGLFVGLVAEFTAKPLQ